MSSCYATAIILDIGRNLNEDVNKTRKSFFEMARACVIRIIEMKMMSRPDDLIALILLGTKKTQNPLAESTENQEYRRISLVTDFVKPTWDLLENVPNETTKYEGDWFEALLVAVDRLQNGIYGKKTIKKIICITNFKSEASLDDADDFMEGFKDTGVSFDIIGPDLQNSEKENNNISVALKLTSISDGVSVTFDEAMQYLMFHRCKATRPFAWNVDLSIGPNIKIPVSVYARIRDETDKIRFQLGVKDPITGQASTTLGVFKKHTYYKNDDNEEVSYDDLTKGYCYGQEIVPLSEDDRKKLYNAGPKCLSIYGFTEAKNVEWQCLTGNGTSYVYERKGDTNSKVALRTLVYALHNTNMVGVARRVYNNGNAPKMFALFPLIDGEVICLSMIELCFKGNIKNMSFPSIKNNKSFIPTDEEVAAIKDLIKSMDLTKAYSGDEEAFPLPELVNPSVQHIKDCIIFKALNPEKPLPPPRDDIVNLFKLPKSVKENSRIPLEKVKELFKLKTVEPRRKRNNKSKPIDLMNLTSDTTVQGDRVDALNNVSFNCDSGIDEVTYIGTLNPAEDLKVLLGKGKTLDELKCEIQGVIENFIYLSYNSDYEKPFECMKVYRDECIKTSPNVYNSWLCTLKKELAERGKINVISMIVKEKLDLITNLESSLSDVTESDLNEEDIMYNVDTQPKSTQLESESDIEDFFAEM